MDEINLQILNGVWDSMKGATWLSRNTEFTLDYVCANDSALKCVESAYILERVEVMDEINLQILNCVWDSMKGATWFSENTEFTLDYVCANDSALKCVESAYILERVEVMDEINLQILNCV